MTRSQDNYQLVDFRIPFLVLTYIGAILFAVFAAQISNGACAIVANFQNGVYHTEESKKMSIAVYFVVSVCMSFSGLYNDISHCKYVKGRLFFLENISPNFKLSNFLFQYITANKRLYLIYPGLVWLNVLTGLGFICFINI